MIVSNEIVENMIIDFKKKEISSEDKSVLIKSYLKEEKISERELARRLDISHSTLHDWVSLRQKNKSRKSLLTECVNNDDLSNIISRLRYKLSLTSVLDDKIKSNLKELKKDIEKIII
jgi:DNA-binding transcriptional regulator YiaG